jgi:hypothetical protein
VSGRESADDNDAGLQKLPGIAEPTIQPKK